MRNTLNVSVQLREFPYNPHPRLLFNPLFFLFRHRLHGRWRYPSILTSEFKV
ncbi:hypothetical protein D779_0816 [Imhoffiella purpurea]|uniref:Uncharacterized protein n=1 Tax=Imhoffiella purpurea TaxID=1249627 RepID=W9VC93_9GAMM|nr:hypothetical protein D779_0816 [Imhoffiella purpurea]